MPELAPIALSTYSRINHLKETVNSLKKNTLAGKSELYIFSDGPRIGDENKVKEVRNYIREIDGFKGIHIIEREQNNRVINNRGGMVKLLNEYGKMIFLEEDISTAPGFLSFMNQALDYYQKNKKIVSITGYSPPINVPSDYNSDAFALRRFSAWGFGLWVDRFNPLDIEVDKNDIVEILNDPQLLRKFLEFGEDMEKKIIREVNGNIDALDAKLMYHAFKHDLLSIYPLKSLVRNTGHDGSGLHSKPTGKYDVNLWEKTGDFDLTYNIEVNEKIKRANLKFRKIGIRGKLMNLFK